jgi:ribosomal protein S18 acetylase RimI-like enzyme
LQSSLQFKILTDSHEMMDCYELIKLLNPKLSREEYALLINQMIPNHYKQLIALQNGLIMGVCGYWINTKIYSGKYIELDNVVVDVKNRKQNIGKQLCLKVLEIAEKENCKVAMLDAYLENEEAHRFYERLGYFKKGFHFIKKLN